jgi:RNA-directed DNA polymerase
LNSVPRRGGNWISAADAGVFALNLNNARSNVNTNIGARPALGDCQKPMAYWAAGQSAPQKDASTPAAALRRGRNTEQDGRSSKAQAPAFGPFAHLPEVGS